MLLGHKPRQDVYSSQTGGLSNIKYTKETENEGAMSLSHKRNISPKQINNYGLVHPGCGGFISSYRGHVAVCGSGDIQERLRSVGQSRGGVGGREEVQTMDGCRSEMWSSPECESTCRWRHGSCMLFSIEYNICEILQIFYSQAGHLPRDAAVELSSTSFQTSYICMHSEPALILLPNLALRPPTPGLPPSLDCSCAST